MVRPLLFPLQADTCDDDLLRDARAASDDLGVPLHLHAAQGWFEYATTLRRWGRSPLARLADLRVLGPRTVLAHAAFVAGHPQVPFAADDDLHRLADSGAGVVHCPTVLARRGVALHSIERYRAMGIPVAVSTDTFPRDLTAEVRLASYLTRVLDRDPGSGLPWTMLSAVTDVAADLIGAPDLGRLAPGFRADLVAFDLGRLHVGPVVDPVSTWLHTARGEDVVYVAVAGRPLVDRRTRRPATRERELLEVQREGARRTWTTFDSWHPSPRDADGEVRRRTWLPDGDRGAEVQPGSGRTSSDR
jgi:cytosine/adenosine deaminase-related metal-dependent hydrolase